jgi:two-component system chemotaxis response regulator CheY
MGLNVLIVDDSAFMRNMLKNLISQAGGEVVAEAVDGNDAIAKYNEKGPDLVFMDIMMPNKTGLEALKEIMQADKNAKIIMCTSVGQEKVVAEAVEAGASDFIVKPFKPEDINTVIGKYNS